MLIKICGIKTVKAALAAADAGADMIGLVFAKSKRQLTIEEAKEICQSCRALPIDVVGVFRNQPIDEVNKISETVDLDFVQLHGEESLKECRQVKSPLIRALNHVEVKGASRFFEVAAHLLIDSPKPGSGEAFNWETLKHDRPAMPFILAGGLSASNVAEAIEAVQPDGVDVSSGVETDGEKDEEKIRAFIKRARNVEMKQKERSR